MHTVRELFHILQPTLFDRKTTCLRKACWTVQNRVKGAGLQLNLEKCGG
jgi:hypothetical protein